MELPPLFAVCVFKAIGWLYLRQMDPSSPIEITGNLTGLTKGNHGTHIHEFGSTLKACGDSGPHFNPFDDVHGAPTTERNHVGDFGNINVDDNGTVFVDIDLNRASLYYPTVLGRAIVVHSGEDDLGVNNDESSRQNGNSGPRFDCCVIALANEKEFIR